jgi:hypothetical protein
MSGRIEHSSFFTNVTLVEYPLDDWAVSWLRKMTICYVIRRVNIL